MKIFGVPYHPRQIHYVIGDLLAVAAAVALAHFVRLGGPGDADDQARLLLPAMFFAIVSIATLYVADGYSPSLDFRRPQQIIRLWLAVLATLVAQMLVTFVVPELWWGRGISGLTSLAFGVLLTIWRPLLCWLRPGPVFQVRTLIVGDGEASRTMASAILADPEHLRRYALVGMLRYPRFGHRRLGDTPPTEPPFVSPIPVLGTVAELGDAVRKHKIELVIVAIRGSMASGLAKQLLDCKAAGIQIEEMPTVYKRLTGKVPIVHLSDAWLIFGPVFAGTSRLELAGQRVFDILLSAIGLILSGPVIALAAIAVKLETPGPAFFRQERLGRNEVPFQIIKLRTMGKDAEVNTGAVWSLGPSDPRVTRVGRFLRRTRIDELPQFWNVFRGDMSIVGPRPEREFFVRRLEKSIPFYGLRFSVKPGVTGWAQVNFRYGATDEEAAEKLCYELFAIQELTPVLYGFILLKTVQTMLLRPGS